MKIVTAVALATIGLAGASALASAMANEPYFPRSEKRLQRLDANRDGKLTVEELAPVIRRRTAAVDSNGDRALTAAEIEAAMQKRIEKRRDRIMALMDADKDGTITEAEMDAVLADMFDKADTDDDGAVDLAEIQAFKRAQWRKGLLERRAN